MMKLPVRFLSCFAIVVMIAAFTSLPMRAEPVLEDVKSAGLVGERYDGYLGLVSAEKAPNDVRQLVADVNARRREVYTKMSLSTGKSLTMISGLTAQKQYELAQSGVFFMDAAGRWYQKE